jgi:NitT/TauT family transport system permease protein
MSLTVSNQDERETAVSLIPAVNSHIVVHVRVHRPVSGNSRLLNVLLPTLLGVFLLLGWYMSTATGAVPGYMLPGFGDVGSALWDGLTSGLFLSNAWVTLQESLGGFLIAAALALPIGYGLAKGRLFAATIQPYLVAGQAIPAIVIAPFLIIWLNYGMFALIILCALVVFFPMEITMSLGFQTLDRSLLEAARVEGASFWPLLTRIELPLALPAIMAAVRTGLTLSIIGALVGEFVNNSDQGLGALIQIAKSQYNVPLMFATVIILAILATAFYGLARGLTRLSEAIFGS